MLECLRAVRTRHSVQLGRLGRSLWELAHGGRRGPGWEEGPAVGGGVLGGRKGPGWEEWAHDGRRGPGWEEGSLVGERVLGGRSGPTVEGEVHLLFFMCRVGGRYLTPEGTPALWSPEDIDSNAGKQGLG